MYVLGLVFPRASGSRRGAPEVGASSVSHEHAVGSRIDSIECTRHDTEIVILINCPCCEHIGALIVRGGHCRMVPATSPAACAGSENLGQLRRILVLPSVLRTLANTS